MFRSLKYRLIALLLLVQSVAVSSSLVMTAKAQEKTPTAEQVAETVILVYGSRTILAQIRRNGVERGRLTRSNADGRTEESSYERRFIRGEATAKDRVRVDQKMPSAEYALVYGNGNIWGVLGNSIFAPREDAKIDLVSSMWHDLDVLLRYKENNATLKLVGKEKHKNIDMWVLEVSDPEQRRTRYFISSQTYRVLWLEYEQPGTEPSQPNKFKKSFHDYRVAQGTLVPFRTVLSQNGNQMFEKKILTITFGIKMDESIFRNTETSNAALNN